MPSWIVNLYMWVHQRLDPTCAVCQNLDWLEEELRQLDLSSATDQTSSPAPRSRT